MPSTAPLSAVNYLNLVGYLLNTLVTYAIGFFGAGNLPDNGTVSAKYQTLITPAGWAFAIWGLIFLVQLVFVVVQLTGQYRAHPMVIEGVKSWYFWTCVAQFTWSPVFAKEKIVLSSIVMTLILTPLVHILTFQYKTQSDGTRAEFWLLRFPFDVHCGWITAAFAVNINAAIVAGGSSSSTQCDLAIASIVYVVLVAGFCLFFLKKANYTVPLVLAWATFGIAMELRAPQDLIVNTFSSADINAIRLVSTWVCAVLLMCSAGRGFYQLWRGKSGEASDEASETSYLGTEQQQGTYS